MKVSVFDRYKALGYKTHPWEMKIVGVQVRNLFLSLYQTEPDKEKRTILNQEFEVFVYPKEFVSNIDVCINTFLESPERKKTEEKILRKLNAKKQALKSKPTPVTTPKAQTVSVTPPTEPGKRIRKRIVRTGYHKA